MNKEIITDFIDDKIILKEEFDLAEIETILLKKKKISEERILIEKQ